MKTNFYNDAINTPGDLIRLIDDRKVPNKIHILKKLIYPILANSKQVKYAITKNHPIHQICSHRNTELLMKTTKSFTILFY